jgi:hypothetical protein
MHTDICSATALAIVVNLTLLYIWHIFPKSYLQERSTQRPEDFGCNSQDMSKLHICQVIFESLHCYETGFVKGTSLVPGFL